MSRVAVLISGSGTNLQALIDATRDPEFPAEIVVVISNRSDAYGLERARQAGIPTEVLSGKPFPSRERYDAALVAILRQYQVDWVALAGFLRLVTHVLLDAYPWRVLNIHPSLLPAFPGLNAQQQALTAGVQITGVTVHLVDTGLDTGPILAQGAVPIWPDDDLDRLNARILQMEHHLYPMVLRWAVEGRITMTDEKVVRVDIESRAWMLNS